MAAEKIVGTEYDGRMTDKEFDSRIKDALLSCSETPDEGLWDRIEVSLAAARRRRLLRRACIYASAAAVAVLALLFPHFLPDGEKENPLVASVVEEKSSGGMPGDALDGKPGSEELPSCGIEDLPAVSGGGSVTWMEDGGRADDADAACPAPVADDTGSADTGTALTGMAEEHAEAACAVEDENEAGRYQENYVADMERPSRKRPARSGRFSVSFSGNMSLADKSGNVDFTSPQYTQGMHGVAANYGIVPITQPRHSMPVSAGVEFSYSFLKDRLAVGLGVNYTLLHSRYEAIIDRKVQGNVTQTVHYIGVPLNLYFNIVSTRRFLFYVYAGGAVEKAVGLTYSIDDLLGMSEVRNEAVPSVQWSAGAGIGFEYRFVKFMGLYFNPEFSYYFDCGQPYSVRTEQPMQFGFDIGFRFHLDSF